MKKKLLILLSSVMLFTVSCKQNVHNTHETNDTTTTNTPPTTSPDSAGAQLFTQPIPVDTADSMIQCYLNSINHPSNDSDITSFIVNADTLRSYLNDTSRGKITQVKLMFAHTLSCVHSPHANSNCGYNDKALTIIVVGYDKNNNYVLNAQGMVYDRTQTCPPYCPTSGTAANDLIQ